MPATTLFRTRVPTARLRKAEKIFARLGMKPGDAINIFLAKVEQDGDFPFDLRKNETAELMKDPAFVAHWDRLRAGKVQYVDLEDVSG